jgi:HD superfamily phosphodiesterase
VHERYPHHQGEKIGLDYDPELLYVGAMFHDIGIVEGHRSEHERFEIDGTNAARDFLERDGLAEYVRPNFCDYIRNSRFDS